MIVSASHEFPEIGNCMRIDLMGSFEGTGIKTPEIGTDCKPVVFPGLSVVIKLQKITDGSC